MQNTITEIQNSLKQPIAEHRRQKNISEVEDRLVEITDAEQKKDQKQMKRVSENSGTMLKAHTSIL